MGDVHGCLLKYPDNSNSKLSKFSLEVRGEKLHATKDAGSASLPVILVVADASLGILDVSGYDAMDAASRNAVLTSVVEVSWCEARCSDCCDHQFFA